MSGQDAPSGITLGRGFAQIGRGLIELAVELRTANQLKAIQMKAADTSPDSPMVAEFRRIEARLFSEPGQQRYPWQPLGKGERQ